MLKIDFFSMCCTGGGYHCTLGMTLSGLNFSRLSSFKSNVELFSESRQRISELGLAARLRSGNMYIYIFLMEMSFVSYSLVSI
jgi:hypothetical protein